MVAATFPSFCAFSPSKICSHHQSLVPASPDNCAKEQRKLCQSNSSCTLLSDFIVVTALYISLPGGNFQWLPISAELNRNFVAFHSAFHSGYILASASLSGALPVTVFHTDGSTCRSLDRSYFLRPWFSCTVCCT